MKTDIRRGIHCPAAPWVDMFARSGTRNAMLANNWWIIGLRGALGVIIGTVALTTPGETKSVLIVCYATYMFLDGILAIEAALAISPHHTDWVELILEGVVNLFAGAVALLLPLKPCSRPHGLSVDAHSCPEPCG
jgi:uncharacterized membrane protein HdeD (DUF308 family)